MSQNWKTLVRNNMRKMGHQPIPITKESKGSHIYNGGCKRCDIKVTVDTSKQFLKPDGMNKELSHAMYKYRGVENLQPPQCQ